MGKNFWASVANTQSVPFTTITRFVSPREIEVSASATSNGSGRIIVWGHDDSAAIRATVAAARDYARKSATPDYFCKGVTISLPPGGYMLGGDGGKEYFDQTGVGINNASCRGFVNVIGAGSYSTFLFPAPPITSTANQGALNRMDNGRGITGGFAIQGAQTQYSNLSTFSGMWRVVTPLAYDIQAWQLGGMGSTSTALLLTHPHTTTYNISAGESEGINQITISDSYQIHYSLKTNNGSWRIANVTSSPEENQAGVMIIGGIFDETSSSAQLTIDNSRFVRFIGSHFFVGQNDGILVQNNSLVYLDQVRVVKFGDQAAHNNQDALDVDSTSTVYISNSFFKGYGTGVAIRSAGKVIDLGGNTLVNGTAGAGFGVLFSELGSFLVANGQTIFCRDCTIANPCAGGGTGAIAKRLNGVNICN